MSGEWFVVGFSLVRTLSRVPRPVKCRVCRNTQSQKTRDEPTPSKAPGTKETFDRQGKSAVRYEDNWNLRGSTKARI